MSTQVARRASRPGRRPEHGFTLIDCLVAIAIMSTSIVVIVGGFANAAKSAGIASDQTQLEAVMRNVADWVRSPAIPYVYCPVTPAPGGDGTYAAAIKAALPPQYNASDTVSVIPRHADPSSAVTNGV